MILAHNLKTEEDVHCADTYMVKNTNIQLRINEELKREAEKVFELLGTNMTGGVTLFLCQVVLKRGIPFLLITEKEAVQIETVSGSIGKTIKIMVEESLKAEVKSILKALHLTTTDAIIIFLIRVVQTKSIPFIIDSLPYVSYDCLTTVRSDSEGEKEDRGNSNE